MITDEREDSSVCIYSTSSMHWSSVSFERCRRFFTCSSSEMKLVVFAERTSGRAPGFQAVLTGIYGWVMVTCVSVFLCLWFRVGGELLGASVCVDVACYVV